MSSPEELAREKIDKLLEQRVMDIIDPPPQPELPAKQIGFHVKERSALYRTRPKRT
jgi:hypothetical protein